MNRDNNRKEYFRRYYLDNKKKYTRERERETKVEKRGRPRKVIPEFIMEFKKVILNFD